MTPLQVSKIQQAIRDCDRFIAIEGPRSADLRPADIQEALDFSRAHRQKMLQVLGRN